MRRTLTHVARTGLRRGVVVAASTALAAGGVGVLGGVVAPVGAASAATCAPAGSTGLTAALVATTGQNISGQTLNAAGCDVGIFVGPGVTGVTITHETVTGANDHGIFAVDTSGLQISQSTVTGNGVAPNKAIAENKAIELVGVSGSSITGNTVTANTADGGIGIADNGPLNPGAPNPGGAPTASTNDTVSGNHSDGNFGGCGIVIAAYNPGGGISFVTVTGNNVAGTVGKFGPHGPVIGGIVVAADTPATSVSNVSVQGNTITGSFIPGIVVHSNAPKDGVSGVTLKSNTLSLDDWGAVDGPPQPAGIVVAASQIPAPVTPTLTGTTIQGNTISQEFYGAWLAGASATTIAGNTVSTFPKGSAVFNVPTPGSGYWLSAADGGVFNYGQAGFYGSTGGVKLNAPIVGLAPSPDQGGYWEVAKDGGVFNFGDAGFYGSTGGMKLNAPIVGMAATPYGVAQPPASPATTGKGYWLVASDGGVFSFGDAKFQGSTGGVKLVKPIVGMAAAPDGLGYWLVASDGGVFSFGSAKFEGSTGGMKLNAPIVGISATPDGHGYWLVASDGGVFSFGDAKFYGSTGGMKLNAPIVGISATPDGHGYRLVAADGGVFSFGDAKFLGSTGGAHLVQPVVGMATVGATPAA
jgi:parallel beta-helix repeat protein